MPEPPAPAPRVVSIEIPKTERRTPFVVVHVAVGPLTLAVGVVLPRSGWLEVRPPLSILGKPAVTADPLGFGRRSRRWRSPWCGTNYAGEACPSALFVSG